MILLEEITRIPLSCAGHTLRRIAYLFWFLHEIREYNGDWRILPALQYTALSAERFLVLTSEYSAI